MNLKQYIESGVLELYALGALSNAERVEVDRLLAIYTELGEELERIQMALESFVALESITPKPELKDKVINAIVNLEKEKAMDLNDLPLINKFSDYKNWLSIVQEIGALNLDTDGRFMKVLRHDEKVIQILIVSTTDIEEEIHAHEHESFLILDGVCRCTIGEETRMMRKGDFMAIPLFEPHDVQLISPKVTAILQRVNI